ncbi:unnamed protein product [Lathyrus oleraceus]
MLRRKNMAQILMFVHALVIFLSLFLVVTSSRRRRGPLRISCFEHTDCPEKTFPLVMRCIDNFCQYRLIAED